MADHEEAPVVTDKPRKRKIEGSRKEKNKKLRLSSHITGSDCGCKTLECFEIVNEQNRARLITSFNALPTKDARDSYLAGMITVAEIQRRRPRSDQPKSSNNNSYNYRVFVPGGDDSVNLNYFAYVCFKAFLSIFGIKKGRLEFIKKSLSTEGDPPIDQRGKHENRPHKMKDQVVKRIRDHISSFRGRQSHYSQEKTRRVYLPEQLNINKMYELFLAKNDDVKVSYESYRTIFTRDFNISFGYPRTDKCSKCDEFKIRIDQLSLDVAQNPQDAAKAAQLNDLKIERDLHQRKAETFYKRKKDARLRAKTTPDMEAFTFDFQKNLNIPNKSTNDFYYHRKLTFQSFNIHQLSTNDVHMYCYDETLAKKGSDDVASMLYHHFMNNVPEHVRHINLFCDSCAGQNKNYTIIRFMDYLVHYKTRFDSVTVTFPERGHSYMECDRDMGLINTKAPTNVPSDWMEEFRRARKNPSPFSVVEVTKEIIMNFTDTLKPLYKKGCPVPTRPLREIRFNIQDPGVLSHRDTWNGQFLRTDINVVVGRRTRPPVPGELKQLYKDRLPISTATFKDLQILKRFSSDEAFFDALLYDDRKDDADDDECLISY